MADKSALGAINRPLQAVRFRSLKFIIGLISAKAGHEYDLFWAQEPINRRWARSIGPHK
jgi:hypothetical protein